ncbi:MAG: class I tRNA ligase family protein [Alphaproteobacteria bacterium]|nr:class I tRNA ligase family protein [Alphaproteobacteria bacterium]MCB9696355.1 class I tRNA ligase family protein [Alphaproteobacteria bacterium]
MRPAPVDLRTYLSTLPRPSRVVVTAGMPYANGPLHIGHLAGAHVPADVFARWMAMLVGRDNVLFVCGTDDHGSTSEIAAAKAGRPIRDFIDGIHDQQQETLRRYAIGLDTYTGTSRPETRPRHLARVQEMFRTLYANDMLEKRTSEQWYDPVAGRFLPDRLVRGTCPNPKCGNPEAYSDECEVCGSQYDPRLLGDPRSAISDATPIMKETVHWWLDLWKVAEVLREWVQTRKNVWRGPVYQQVLNTVLPSLRFDNVHEAAYKTLKSTLPAHKMKYGLGKKVVLQFEDREALRAGRDALLAAGIDSEWVDDWAHRSITRDVAWGLELPVDLDPELEGKTLYVWPDSLIAPIAFTETALEQSGRDPASWRAFWCDPDAHVYQFLGQDNVYFYTLMQGALWLGTQSDPLRLPRPGELQLTDVFGCFHLQVDGEKMSKSRGNFYTGDQLLDEKGYDPDQVRYYLALLGLPEKGSNFDFAAFDERNRFLAGPMNAAFERPISAAHSKFDGKVPEGVLLDKVVAETDKIVRQYVRAMSKAEYSTLLFAIENYARQINSLFTQYKPHDDRHPEEARRNALYSSFYVLKTLMIMLWPFVPDTMERLRESLRLPPDVFRVDELGTAIPAGHELGPKGSYFPSSGDAA